MNMPGSSHQRKTSDHVRVSGTGLRVEVVAARAGVSVRRVLYLERAGLVTSEFSGPQTRLYNEAAIERIQLIERLMSDLGVNLPGAEVIVNMRERMLYLLDELEKTRRQ